MSRRNVLAMITVLSGGITLILIPVVINVASLDFPQWVKDNSHWAWLLIIGLGIITAILAKISLSLTAVNIPQLSTDELNDITTRINNAVRLANNEHLQSKDEKDWNTILTSWQDYASTLKEMYSRNHNQQNKQAKHVTKVVLDLFERLTNATRKIFLYLNQKQEFIVFASDAYNIGYEQRKWLYAAELAYEIGCVCHELGKHEESSQWIELLTTCLIKVENFDGAWENVYNERVVDPVAAFPLPNDQRVAEKFSQALMWAAKLYDLQGMNASNDAEAYNYLHLARVRAEKLPEQTVYAWIQIHTGDLEDLRGKPTTSRHYIGALKIADAALLVGGLDIAHLNDLIHLKLTCCNKLGRLAFADARTQDAIDWYEQQLNLAEQHGRRDFIVLAHESLAKVYFQGNAQDLQKASQHAIAAWNSRRDFSDIGSDALEEARKFTDLIVDIMKSTVKNAQAGVNPP